MQQPQQPQEQEQQQQEQEQHQPKVETKAASGMCCSDQGPEHREQQQECQQEWQQQCQQQLVGLVLNVAGSSWWSTLTGGRHWLAIAPLHGEW